MAGRGTDIVLGGKWEMEVAELGEPPEAQGATTGAGVQGERGTQGAPGGQTRQGAQGGQVTQGEQGEQVTPATQYEQKVAAIRADWQQRHDQVVAAGGLHIIGTERHESRRIDNQLRGRAGRQGDPGYSRFYLSMDDNLMRIFASEAVKTLMRRLGHGAGRGH